MTDIGKKLALGPVGFFRLVARDHQLCNQGTQFCGALSDFFLQMLPVGLKLLIPQQDLFQHLIKSLD